MTATLPLTNSLSAHVARAAVKGFTVKTQGVRERARNGPKTITIDGVEYNPFWYG